MKKLLRKVGRAIFFAMFIFFVAASAALGSLLIIKNNDYLKVQNDYNQIRSEFEQASSGINKSTQEKQSTIDQLSLKLKELEQKNSELQTIADSSKKNGAGIISGKISGQIILGKEGISQYQLVCAQNTENPNQIYCQSVSSITQTFEISLPNGKYIVYSKVLGKDNQIVLNEFSGKYTEYVKCLTEKATGICDTSLSKKQITVEVKSSQKVINVNPVDWN